MSKYKLPNPDNTPLDPFAFEKRMGLIKNNDPYIKVDQGLEFNLEAPIEEGYSSLGNSRYAQRAIEEFKAEQEGSFGLLTKGIGRTLAKTGTEVLKVPGYVGGGVAAIGNEVLGDGKNSMSLMIDNAWVNALEGADESLKELIPVHIKQEVQDGNLLDKMTSGAWWATQGADGLGFMLSMFAPGAATKLLGTGKALGALSEVVANTKAGKLISADKFLGLSSEVADIAKQVRVGEAWIRNADGVAAATVNTALEAAAEAAGTFDNTLKQLKEKIKTGEITEEYARQIAGEKASSVFKSNLSLLMVSNLLEQAWVFKAFGGNTDGIINKAFKEGNFNLDDLKALGNKSFKQSAKEYSSGLSKNALKEGFFEEGIQTQIEQDVNKIDPTKGEKGDGFLGGLTSGKRLLENIFTGSDDFWKNTELHESIFLGSVLGGGVGLIGQMKENANLRSFLNGYNRANESNSLVNKFLQRTGFKQSKQDSEGLIKALENNFIKNFKTDLSYLQTDGKIDSKKLEEAWRQQKKEEFAHAQYDAAVVRGDEVEAAKWNSIITQNYVQPFLGQQDAENVFEKHVKTDLTELWKSRYQQNYNTAPTQEQVDSFQRDFIENGLNVFRAHNEAQRTNYPERFLNKTGIEQKRYAKFRELYFKGKFQNLLQFQSLKTIQEKIDNYFNQTGLAGKIERTEEGYKILESLSAPETKDVQDYFKTLGEIKKQRNQLSEEFEMFFNKEKVQELYDNIDESLPEDVIKEDNQELKKNAQNVQKDISKNETTLDEKLKEPENVDGVPVVVNNKKTTLKKENGVFVDEDGVEYIPLDLTSDKIKIDVPSLQEEIKPVEVLSGEITDELTPWQAEGLNQFEEQTQEQVEDLNKLFATPEESELNQELDSQEQFLTQELGKVPETDRRTGGKNVQYTLIEHYRDQLTPEGLPVLGTENQQVFFNFLDNIESGFSAYQVKLFQIKDLRQTEMFEQASIDMAGIKIDETDLYAVVFKEGVPVKKDDKFIIQSISRPETIYNQDNLRVTKKYIESFEGNTFQEKFNNAKEQYSKWYYSFNTPKVLEINDISKGHPVVRRDKDGKVIWNPLKQLKQKYEIGVSVSGEVYTSRGVVQVKKGDVVAVTNSGVYPLKVRNLNNQEVNTIISYLEMFNPATFKSTALTVDSLTGPKQIGVFYDEQEVPLLKHLVLMEKDKEGSFWFDSTGKFVVFHPYGKEKQQVKVEDLSNSDSFRTFLFSKRKHINRNLFNKNAVVDLKETKQKYQDHIAENDLTTYVVSASGYPNRLQRYIVFGDEVPQVNQEIQNLKQKSLSERRKRAKEAGAKLDADKIFSVEEMLQIKIQSQEIIKQC